jgi:hypothetical protein
VVYDPAKYKNGASVRIVDRTTLEEFYRTYNGHHRLQADQLDSAGRVVTVKVSAMYHGGDVLYQLEGAPGIWHEEMLVPA